MVKPPEVFKSGYYSDSLVLLCNHLDNRVQPRPCWACNRYKFFYWYIQHSIERANQESISISPNAGCN